MAYTRVIPTQCCETCGRKAYAEVIGQNNASHGLYCKKHAEALASKLNGNRSREVLSRA